VLEYDNELKESKNKNKKLIAENEILYNQLEKLGNDNKNLNNMISNIKY